MNELAPIKMDGKWGFATYSSYGMLRDIIIPCIYQHATEFQNGLAGVRLNDKWGFINEQGEIIIPCIYKVIGDFNKQGFAIVTLNEKCGIIDRTGTLIIPCIFNYIDRYIDEYTLVAIDTVYLFIDSELNYYRPGDHERIACEECAYYNDKLTVGLCCRLKGHYARNPSK